MKRTVLLIALALLTVAVLTLAAGCQSGGSASSISAGPSESDSGTTSSTAGAPETSESPPPDSTPTTQATASPVLSPQDLLTAEEASEISGFAITMDPGTLYEDPASGVISERYVYDINGTGIHALLEVHQDGLKSSEAIQAGETVLSSFEFEKELSKDEITAVDLGEQAFTFNNTGQLHMYYKGYYVVVAFEADEYDSSLSAPLNIQLGEKILANLQEALQG